MGTLFTLTPGVKGIITTALDDLITELGKDCVLIYPSRWTSCVNCIFDPAANASANRYRPGGPIPFLDGTLCPVCAGKGKAEQEVSETIRMLCAWQPKDFYLPISESDLRVPGGLIQTKFYLKDRPKVVRADHCVFESAIEPSVRMTYRLDGDPADVSNIIQGRYCVATWRRVSS